MISIRTTTALIMAVSSVLGVAPIAALAQTSQDGTIDDRDTNTQVNAALAVQSIDDGDNNFQGIGVAQSNSLEDNDANVLTQVIQ
jgi:hypothetical protein